MFKKNLKTGLCAFLISVIIGMSLSIASAATASSNTRYYILGGYSYQNFALVTANGGAWAGTFIGTQDYSSVPTGYMAAKAYLYDATTGAIIKQTDWIYNTQSSGGYSISTAHSTVSSTYYGKGSTSGWNGSSYYPTYSTYNTPNVIY